MKTTNQKIALLLMILAGIVFQFPASAALITLTNNDASGSSSFNAKLNWNDNAAPNFANDYLVTNSLVMRTPASSANFTFQGKSLTLSGGGGWFYKASGNGFTITVGTNAATGLTMNNGRSQVVDGGRSFTLAGFVNLGPSGGSFDPFNGTTTVSAQIAGSGTLNLSVASTATTGGALVLSGTNTYTGGTIINAAETLRLAGAGTLGATSGFLQFLNTGNKGYGFLDLNGTSQGIGNLSGSLSSGLSAARIFNNAPSTTSTLTIGNGDTGGGNYPGAITNGAGVLALTKVGNGIITLSGTNTYTGGTTISGGALQMATITGALSGAGTLVLMAPGTNTPQQISGGSFSGPLIVQAGWLIGTNGAFGTNSITVNPGYVLDPSASGATLGTIAVLEPKYDLNSAGSLTIANGGMIVLHQNCAFTSVTIESIPLSAGIHTHSELSAIFPNNFTAGGSGAITVQPYGTLPTLAPEIAVQPASISRYPGYAGQFNVTVAGSSPVNHQWRKGGINLVDAGNIAGATTSTLSVSNISAADVADYTVVISNTSGSVTSSIANLTLRGSTGYESAVVAAAPKAYYRLDETGDPATNNSPAFDYAGGFDGVYGVAVQNGSPNYNITGPRAVDGFPGFADTNTAGHFFGATANSRVTIPALNLNTNTVTLTAWVNPGIPAANAGVIFCRGGGTVAGLNFSTGSFDPLGARTIGYTWNNDAGTYTWNSQISPIPGEWSFVALVITPTNATVYVFGTNSLKSASQNFNHIAQSFSVPTLIGEDSFSGTRQFDGTIDEVAIFSSALTQAQLTDIYAAGSGISSFAPLISSQPVSQNLYEQQIARLSVQASGSQPLTYRWQKLVEGIYENVVDGGRISGATTASLTISNLALGDAADYQVIVSNGAGSLASSPATITVNPIGPPETITMSVVETSGQSWESGFNWSDGLAASVSSISKPGSTYRILPSAAMRTLPGAASATFPGNELYVEGNGVFNTSIPGSGIGALIIKSSNGGIVNFKKLIMAGGEILNFIDSGGNAVLGGELNIIGNTPIHSSDDTSARSIRIESQLTGNGTIEYRAYTGGAFVPTRVSSLNIAGTNNTYSGTWNVVLGTLVGSAPNSLGTNTIIVGANGALQTTYDLNNPSADLILNGRINLTQNDTFRSLVINGVGIAPGTYTFSQLTNAYPANFPATWVAQPGATVTNGSGSITVLSASAPLITRQPASINLYEGQTALLTVTAVGNQTLGYQWKKWNGSAYVNVANGGTISGAQTASLTISNVIAGNAGDYLVVVTNSLGSATSAMATLTVTPVGPPLNVIMFAVQPNQTPFLSWDSAAWWDNNQPASQTAVSNPGSTFEIISTGAMRTPAGAATATFPGSTLKVTGDGIYNGGGVGRIIIKSSSGGTVIFPNLIMNGGQIDNFIDSSGNAVIEGVMHIAGANTPINAPNTGSGGSIRIDAQLTGTGNIEYHAYAGGAFQPTWVSALTIAGTGNTYSGTWNVVLGTLVGTGVSSLGTNTITVGAQGALQTTYNINNANGDLILDGRMNLTQHDTFRNVIVEGVQLAAGIYTFAQLNNAYPTHFPAAWLGQPGADFNTSGSGSITVLAGPAGPVSVTSSWNGANLTLTWPGNGVLLEAPTVTGPWMTNSSATSPFVISPSGPQKYFRVLVQQ